MFVDSHGQPVVYVAATSSGTTSAAFLRDEQQFTQCVDVTAVDHLVAPDRVDAGRRRGRALRGGRELPVARAQPSHPRDRAGAGRRPDRSRSITDLYPGVNFAEREIYDLFGVEFTGHPDLTRILMPDDWLGHPLRKDDAPARVPVTFKGDPSPR